MTVSKYYHIQTTARDINQAPLWSEGLLLRIANF